MPYTTKRGGGNFYMTMTVTDKSGNTIVKHSERTWWITAFNKNQPYQSWRNLSITFTINGLNGWNKGDITW